MSITWQNMDLRTVIETKLEKVRILQQRQAEATTAKENQKIGAQIQEVLDFARDIILCMRSQRYDAQVAEWWPSGTEQRYIGVYDDGLALRDVERMAREFGLIRNGKRNGKITDEEFRSQIDSTWESYLTSPKTDQYLTDSRRAMIMEGHTHLATPEDGEWLQEKRRQAEEEHRRLMEILTGTQEVTKA